MLVLAVLAVSACGQGGPAADADRQATASTPADPPAAPDVRGADPTEEPPIGRAAPPMLQPIVLGRYVASDGDGRAELSIEDDRIRDADGTVFRTERVALVKAGDEYAKGARYADVLMVGAEQPVELRRVVEEIPAKSGTAGSLCGVQPIGYLALSRVLGSDGREAVHLVALQGDELPAPSSTSQVCKAAQYVARA